MREKRAVADVTQKHTGRIKRLIDNVIYLNVDYILLNILTNTLSFFRYQRQTPHCILLIYGYLESFYLTKKSTTSISSCKAEKNSAP